MVSSERLEDASRAAWLYYVAENTQDQIAQKLGVSRQAAQRLVSLAVAEGLVKVRIDHPIAACLELAAQLSERFSLGFCEIVPADPAAPGSLNGIARAAAAEMERWLSRAEPLVMALGTGRALQASVEQMLHVDCPQHRVVSLTGSILPDGSTSHHSVIYSMAGRISGATFPLPFPVVASSSDERATLHAQAMIKPTLTLAERAEVTFIGIGHMAADAAMVLDGFITAAEQAELAQAGAVGEIIGWAFDAKGHIFEEGFNRRVASAPVPDRDRGLVIGIANGVRKRDAIRGALEGRLVNGLITDEAMAAMLLTA
jgi:DNA-binding transcriptional regulator LsrR (DeoR family)